VSLSVCEIFYSLQGESCFTGLACIFIRLSGCNLNCAWCDTLYAGKESYLMDLHQILDRISRFQCTLVEVTGGEPLIQKETPELINTLIRKKYKVLLETNGSISMEKIHPECIKIMDIKCPSSNEDQSFFEENIRFLTDHDEVKFVVGTRQDYLFAKSFIQTRLQKIMPEKIHISPVFNTIKLHDLASWMLEDNLGARLSIQQHKIIWNPEKRGV
jgi:7-carboxy-7-deazaguanine synthase